ncbi:MAG: SoxR reducing system RseC family protein, partial [Candidatus Accumulibacter sp.]|nr:SoxR reducing system RseC family protein [Accumulibacter sp.]
MAEVRGTVTALDGEHALVRITGEGCGRCHEAGGCGGDGGFARMFCRSPKIHRMPNPRGAKPGDEVTVVVGDRTLFRSAVAGYVLPLLGLFPGAALGLELAGEAGSMIGALCGLAAAWGLQRTRWARDVLLGADA